MSAALNNDFEIAKIVSVEQKVKVDYGSEVERIEEIRLKSGEVRAGEVVRFEVEFSPRRGPSRVETLALRVPEEAAGKKVIF